MITVSRTAKPISRRLITRAADLCAIAASTPGMLLSYGWTSIPDADQEVFDVAWGAVILAGLGRGMTDAERWAAGESYLRCREVEALAAIVRLKDGRFASWTTWQDVTGTGFCCDAYGGRADIYFASTVEESLATFGAIVLWTVDGAIKVAEVRT